MQRRRLRYAQGLRQRTWHPATHPASHPRTRLSPQRNTSAAFSPRSSVPTDSPSLPSIHSSCSSSSDSCGADQQQPRVLRLELTSSYHQHEHMVPTRLQP
jgi:hypothetical protein